MRISRIIDLIRPAGQSRFVGRRIDAAQSCGGRGLRDLGALSGRHAGCDDKPRPIGCHEDVSAPKVVFAWGFPQFAAGC
jgi:hypothetical protein